MTGLSTDFPLRSLFKNINCCEAQHRSLMAGSHQNLVAFGQFELDLERRALSREGAGVKLGSRALEILCVLARAKGEVVSKDELLARVWPGVVVEENNIQVHISALRKALEDNGDRETYLVTVPGRG